MKSLLIKTAVAAAIVCASQVSAHAEATDANDAKSFNTVRIQIAELAPNTFNARKDISYLPGTKKLFGFEGNCDSDSQCGDGWLCCDGECEALLSCDGAE